MGQLIGMIGSRRQVGSQLKKEVGSLSQSNLGPFHGFDVEYRLLSRQYWGGIITSPVDADVINLLAKHKALARSQIAALMLSQSARSAVTRLVRGGFVDEYQSGKTPPIYTLGRGGAEIKELPYRWWDTVDLLRLVAINQLWVCLSKIWVDADWQVGKISILNQEGLVFKCIAPRLRAGEAIFAVQTINSLQPYERLLIVASSENQAKEIAAMVGKRNVRYTWDCILRSTAVFYVYNGKQLVEDDAFSQIMQVNLREKEMASTGF